MTNFRITLQRGEINLIGHFSSNCADLFIWLVKGKCFSRPDVQAATHGNRTKA